MDISILLHWCSYENKLKVLLIVIMCVLCFDSRNVSYKKLTDAYNNVHTNTDLTMEMLC